MEEDADGGGGEWQQEYMRGLQERDAREKKDEAIYRDCTCLMGPHSLAHLQSLLLRKSTSVPSAAEAVAEEMLADRRMKLQPRSRPLQMMQSYMQRRRSSPCFVSLLPTIELQSTT